MIDQPYVRLRLAHWQLVCHGEGPGRGRVRCRYQWHGGRDPSGRNLKAPPAGRMRRSRAPEPRRGGSGPDRTWEGRTVGGESRSLPATSGPGGHWHSEVPAYRAGRARRRRDRLRGSPCQWSGNRWIQSASLRSPQRLPPTRKRPVFVLAATSVQPAQAVPGAAHRTRPLILQSKTSITFWNSLRRDCQMTGRGSNLDSNLNSAAWPISCYCFIASEITA